jgi:glucoamylase
MSMAEGAQYAWLEGGGEAFGAPGLEPRWTSSEKDAVGMAYSSSSNVWFTLSHGVLNEIYHPTIDRPQIRDMEFLITDGETFVHEEKRDLERSLEYLAPGALGVRYRNSDPAGRYHLVKEIIADPHQAVVLMSVRVEAEAQLLERLQLFALLAPHLEGGGANNTGRALEVAGKKLLVAWKNRSSLAMGADCGFERVSCGFVGHSDGYQDLSTNMVMDWEFGSASDGNIALMGAIPRAHTGEFVLAIGFGGTRHAALSKTVGSLSTPFAMHLERFLEQWSRAEAPLELAKFSGDGGRLLETSHRILLAHEDKSYAGAFVASASIPWGQAKGDDDLGGYHLVWTRDMVQTASALLACGNVETARRALVYLACTQRPDGGFAQNFWIDGRPYWTGMQLDEVAFPITLAWRLWKVDGLGKFDVFPFVQQAAGFLVRHAPITQQERWEENAGYSPSTLAVVISGLICAADMARFYSAGDLAEFLEDFADWIEGHLEDWMVTNRGVLVPGIAEHYIRIRPPECGAPYSHEDCAREHVRLNNQPPGAQFEFEAREIVDGGFLELVRYGVRPPDDPVIVNSVKVMDQLLRVETPVGPCWHRYNHDGYGQRPDGGPYLGWGKGRAWPLLTGERAHYELAAGGDAASLLRAMEGFASSGQLLPEQVWDEDDRPDLGFRRGVGLGSAQPLVWAHAEYLKLLRSMMDGVPVDRIEAVYERYCRRRQPAGVEIFSLSRQAPSVRAGRKLRVISPRHFRLHWTPDNWNTVFNQESVNVGYAGFFADIDGLYTSRASSLSFTLFWVNENRWEGRNFEVKVEPPG